MRLQHKVHWSGGVARPKLLTTISTGGSNSIIRNRLQLQPLRSKSQDKSKLASHNTTAAAQLTPDGGNNNNNNSSSSNNPCWHQTPDLHRERQPEHHHHHQQQAEINYCSDDSSSSSTTITGTTDTDDSSPTLVPCPTLNLQQQQQEGASASESVTAFAAELSTCTGLPTAVATRLATAVINKKTALGNCSVVKQRVQQLQQLLGKRGATTAIQHWPSIVSASPESLAYHHTLWRSFFPGPGSQGQLSWWLATRPQLLAVNVETQVANLYEVGYMVQAEDRHAFAYRAMPCLALRRPEAVQDKMRTMLLLLLKASEASSTADDHTRAAAAAAAVTGQRTAVLPAAATTYQSIQHAARRDPRWLMLSNTTLESRMLELQQALQVSMSTLGHMFLQQPSIVLKRPVLLQQRMAALQQLPGLEPCRASAAVVAFPALLNIRSQLLQTRWQLLAQAAGTHTAWQQQLDTAPATTLANWLTCTDSRYSRLEAVAHYGRQPAHAISTLLHMSDQKYKTYADRYLQPGKEQQCPQEWVLWQQQQCDVAAAAGRWQQQQQPLHGPLTLPQMQAILDSIAAVAGSKLTVVEYKNSCADSSAGHDSSSSSSRVRMYYAKTTVHFAVPSTGLSYEVLYEGFVRLCCSWSKVRKCYNLTDKQCRVLRLLVPDASWHMYVRHCRMQRVV